MSVDISTLDSHLFGELVKVYNNTGEYEKAIKLSNDEEAIRWCLELVDFSDFEEILEKTKEKYPILTEKYFAYIN